MKKKFNNLLIFASAGAIFYTGPTAFAADAQLKARTQSDSGLELRGNINQPAGDELRADTQLDQAQLKKASQLIGMDVCNQQNEKIGAVKDLMVDLQSGRAPFAVVSSGGFFGVGDRLMAVPVTTFGRMENKDELVLSLDKQRLQSAPAFDKRHWPDMTDQAWSSQVYSFYGEQPGQTYAQSSITSRRTTINEPAGAELSTHANTVEIYPEAYGETEPGLSPDRRPRQGLGAEDLTRNEQRLNNPGEYAASDVFVEESAGADKARRNTTTTIIEQNETSTRVAPSTDFATADKVKRASELMGMEVKNAQNERIGEIKDLVIDLHSGRVAYAVLEAGGLLEVDKLYAVPPTVFTRSTDGRWLVFNTDKETLKSAPSFEKNNWPLTTNQKFTGEVYRFYHQRPYWQSSGEIREPSGSQQRMKLHNQDRGTSGQQFEQGEIQEPSGAAPSTETPGTEIQEPKQTEPERNQDNQPLGSPRSLENRNQSSATKETSELQSSQPDKNIQEPAGATTESTAKATSEDESLSDPDRQLSQQVRKALETDTVLSPTAQHVKVSAANGKITLRGTVESEQQKQSIAAKAQQIAGGAEKVDNQLQVKSDSTNP